MLKAARERAQEQMRMLHEREALEYENAKERNNEAERKRVQNINKLLKGDTEMVIARLDEVIPKIGLPFPVEVNFEIYNNTMLIYLWLAS